MSCPPFSTCSDCGDEGFPVQTVQVPYCGQTESSDPCVSNKGKFHDRLTEDFIVPKVGNQTKIYICDAKLWAKCQWVGICNGADKIAAYPIMEVGNKTITILNGCRSGESIFGNPDVGKEFSTGTVLYPIPPQGCDSNFCERVAESIRTCGAEGVYDLLKNSEEICFTTVSELDESERGHLFLGTMPDPCNCPSEYGGGEGEGSVGQGEGFWRSCLRKATKIFSNLGGRTLCFADMPTYNKDNDPNEIGRELVLDQKGCIARGNKLTTECSSADAIQNGDGASAIIVCKEGEKKILLPECGKIVIGCCNGDDDPEWKVTEPFLFLDAPITIVDHQGSQLVGGTDVLFDYTIPDNVNKCFKRAIVQVSWQLGGDATNDSHVALSALVKNSLYILHAQGYNDGDGSGVNRHSSILYVPVINNKVSFKRTTVATTTASRYFTLKVVGYSI